MEEINCEEMERDERKKKFFFFFAPVNQMIRNYREGNCVSVQEFTVLSL